MASTNEQIKRIETDILKVQTKIKAYQEKLSQLTEKRKQLQERALHEKISEIAPTYDDAQTLLDLLAAERPSADTKDGGNAHDNEREPPRD